MPKFTLPCPPRCARLVATGIATAASAALAAVATGAAAQTIVQPLVMESALGAAPAPAARADNPLPPDLEATLRTQLQQLALGTSQQALPGVNRVDIEVGQLDPRLKLAPCQRVEPYLPNGTKLWGKARIGLRCSQGSVPWNVYLPITVKVYGNAWVAANTLAAGAVIAAGDLIQAEVDLAEETAAVVSDPEQAVGRSLVRRIAAGQGVRVGDLKARQWFAAGDTVKLVALGPGFNVTTSGQAMTPGLEGQPVRVRVTDPDGTRSRVVTGQATADRVVEVRP